MGCKGRLDLREVLRRIIKNIIQRNLRLLDNQVRALKTYDLAVWEALSQGFLRAYKFVKISKKIIETDKEFEKQARDIISTLFERALKVMEKGKNPQHKTRALAKMIRTAVLIDMRDIKDIVRQTRKTLEEIEDDLDRIKTASYVLFEIGRAFNALNKKESANVDLNEIREQLEKFVQEIYNKTITWISVLDSPESRAKALAFLAEGIRDLSITVKREDNKVEWLDVHEAEIAAQESLREVESISDFYARGIIKSYVAYLYSTLSMDLRDTAEKLYEEAIEIALKNAVKDENKAADLLGQIAFTKALIGQENEAETLFQEACILSLKCPDIDNILTSLKIADLAGKSRMLRTASEVLDQYIIPTIRSLKDGIKRAGLIAIASDVAAWIDIGWGARLAMNAAEEIWMYSPEDVKDGEQIYLLSLGATKAAFSDPDAAWRIFDYVLSILRSDVARLSFFTDYISLEWFGKSYEELKSIPAFHSVFKKELKRYLSDLKRIIPREKFSLALLDLAYGIGTSDKKYVVELIERAIKNDLRTNIESMIFGRAIKVASAVSTSLLDNYLSEALKRAEQSGDFESTMNYLITVLEQVIETNLSRKLAKIIIDIISEAEPRTITLSNSIKRFIEILKKIDMAWANEIQDLIKEERIALDKRSNVFRSIRNKKDN